MIPEIQFEKVLEKPLEITPDSANNTNARIIRVSNRLNLDDLSDMHMRVAASYETQENSVLGLVDRALRINGLVPSWIIDEEISHDGAVEADGVFLDRICGTATYFQLLNPTYLLEGFAPAVYLMREDGQIESAIGSDLSRLHIADYSKLMVGVQFTPSEMSTREIIRGWSDRFHGLSEGNVELSPIKDAKGRDMVGGYSLIGGMTLIQQSDVSEQRHQLKRVYSDNGEEVSDFYVDGDSLVAVADRRLGVNPIYRTVDTYLNGKLDKKSNVYLLTAPGLESAFMRMARIADPRDLGGLIEVPEHQDRLNGSSAPEKTTEPGEGREAGNETKAHIGTKYDVKVIAQGVYQRGDFHRE